MRWAIHGSATPAPFADSRNLASLQSYVIETAICPIGATVGNIALQWAQNVSSATGTIVNANSYVRYRQIG